MVKISSLPICVTVDLQNQASTVENQLKLHNFVRFTYLLLTLFFLGVSKNIPSSFFSLKKSSTNRLFHDFKFMEPELLLFALPSHADIENAPENF
jgi:hypothetical protein